MADTVEIRNRFEMVVLAGARARQLLAGCTPKTTGPKKPARVATQEIRQGHVRKVVEQD